MKRLSIGTYMIASAVVWALVIIACANALAGMPQKHEVVWITTAGATVHLLFIWGPLGAASRKNKPQ